LSNGSLQDLYHPRIEVAEGISLDAIGEHGEQQMPL
jgi:hypothetical protein